MNLFVNTLLHIHNTFQKKEDDSIDDKIFKLRKEMRNTDDSQKFNPENITDSDSNIYYTYENKGKRESHIRHILQNMFQKPFASTRPPWLKNPQEN